MSDPKATDEVDASPMPAAEHSPQGDDEMDAQPSGFHVAPAESDPYVYNMRHGKRGIFLIINNKKFDAKTGMNERTGTDADAANLYKTFKGLGFEVQMYKDLKCLEMLKVMAEAAKYNFEDCDCFACAILSHGDNGVVYGHDGIIQIDMLVAPFKGDRCLSLAGKPKLFFVQACRGNQLDHGTEATDAAGDPEKQKVYRIPAEADFLFAYSTTPGYFSWRNSSRGSWFVQALCSVLAEHGQDKELLSLLTRTNRSVAYEFESNASKEYMNRKKQIPSIVSQLTKELYFSKK